MQWWESVRNRISKANTSTGRTKDGRVEVYSDSFRGLPLKAHKEINNIIDNECRIQFQTALGSRQIDTLANIQERSARLVPTVLNIAKGNPDSVERVRDMVGYRDILSGNGNGMTGNYSWMTGAAGQDPSMSNMLAPNLYLSPSDVVSVYSQGGLPELIISKKAKSMLLDGVRIKNCKLSEEQLEKINENIIRTGYDKAISESVKQSLLFGGAILFPMFRQDSPLAMTLPVPALAKYGVLKKDCIDRWVPLDRWNCTFYPQWNPTAADYIKPSYFYVPWLGTDVNATRISRVITAPPAGYWDMMMTVGWGWSNLPGWLEAYFNYANVMRAIPTMVQQMSLLVRTFNVEGPAIMEGIAALEQLDENETIRVRQASALNPINMDVVGELKAIERNFGQVPELLRFIRQDFAAKAGLMEESMFTTEKAGLGGSENKAAPWTKEHESNRLMYSDVQRQLKSTAMIQTINALGLDRDVIKALPYTEIAFDEQKITDIEDRVEVTAAITRGYFDLVSSQMPMDMAAKMIQQASGNLVNFTSEMMADLEERQARNDELEEEKHDAEVKQMEQPPAMPGAGGGKKPSSSASGKPGEKKGHSYSDRKEQRSHEKVRSGGKQFVGKTRQANKKAGS